MCQSRRKRAWAWCLGATLIGLVLALSLSVTAGVPTVTVEIDASQDDPTNGSPIVFVATFSEAVTEFDESDITVSGTGGGKTVSVTTTDNTVFTIEISNLAGDGSDDGTIAVSISAGVCVSTSTGEPNVGSTSTDNEVLYDTVAPPEPILIGPMDSAVTSDNSLTFSWTTVEDEPGGSGLDNYRFHALGRLASATKNYYTTNSTYRPTFTIEDQYDWYVYARDNAGNISPYTERLIVVDFDPPTNPTLSSPTHPIDSWSKNPLVPMDAVNATDSVSGVAGFETAWNQSELWTGSETPNRDEYWTGASFSATSDGDWWLHAATVDRAGNWAEPIHCGPVKIDTTAPINAELECTSHQNDEWSNVKWVEFTVLTGASDGGAGVDGYDVGWDSSSTWDPSSKIAEPGIDTIQGFTFDDGPYYLHIAAVDRALNWSGAAHFGPYLIDTVAPTNPSLMSPTHTPDAWSTNDTIEMVDFKTSADERSGVAGYEIEWSQDATWTPTRALEQTAPLAEPLRESLPDGSWYFHCVTADEAGNWSEKFHIGPFKIDTLGPDISGNPGDQTVVLSDAAGDAVVSWSEPTAVDAGCGLAEFTSTHASRDAFPIGTTTVTYTATDLLGNTSTLSFNVTVRRAAPLSILPAEVGGADGSFLDRCLDLEEGETPPIVGGKTLQAIYGTGEAIGGACTIHGLSGRPVRNSYVIVELYRLDLSAEPIEQERIERFLVRYSRDAGCYAFAIPTDDLGPGYYDLQLVFPDGSSCRMRIQIIKTET